MRTKVLVGTLVAVIAIGLVVRSVARSRLERGMIITRAQGPKTPGTFGAPFTALDIQSHGRTLKAFYVAPPESGPKVAFAIFHGRQESISSWSQAQAFLWKHGAGSMVFDYAGFGNSTGEPTAANLHEDGIAAWGAFVKQLPPGTTACAYALSLGTGVLLEIADVLEPKPDCIALYGAYTSGLSAAVQLKALPAWAKPLLPDVFDSEHNIARAPAPVLVEHGDEDELFPVSFAETLAHNAPHGQLLVMHGYKHATPLVAPDENLWLPVIAHAVAQRAPAPPIH